MAAIDVTRQVANSIQSSLTSLPPVSSSCCIYRVPETLRKVNDDAYCPVLVSIGPFYHDDPKLEPMREQKLRYLQSFLARNNAYNNNIEYYIEAIRGWEQLVRQCYATKVGLPSPTFIELLLVDSFFIIELFLRSWFLQLIDENDPIFNKPRTIVEVTRDLRIEENQLPFFLVKGLYDLAFGSSNQTGHPSFVNLTYKFFTGKKETAPQRIADADIKHFVDFLRLCHLPHALRATSNNNLGFEFCPSATQLSEAGVKFVASQSEDLLDLKFSKGVFVIPRFSVTDETETLFRNIMVFEQCHYYSDSYLIDYFAFLDGLINTPKDVEILVGSGIIDNWLGNNEEVAILFSNMFKQTRLRLENFYYAGLCKGLKAYANTRWHRWKAILKRDYFNHPWAAISVVYAIVILVLTALQTISGFTSNK